MRSGVRRLEALAGAARHERVALAASLDASRDLVTAAASAMAERFELGGRLFAFGVGPCAPDAAHVTVEFVHPVIAGKRSVPAMDCSDALGAWPAETAIRRRLGALARSGDVALGLASSAEEPALLAVLDAARAYGLLTVVLSGGGGGGLAQGSLVDHLLVAPSTERLLIKEQQVTTYHLLWELVQVFIEGRDRSAAVPEQLVGS